MSEEQQDITVGRAVRQHTASRKNLATLQAETANLADSMYRTAEHLKTLSKLTEPKAGPLVSAIEEDIAMMPEAEHILSMAREIRSEMERKNNLRSTLLQMGVELKD